ncbi:MAG: Putative peptidase, M23B family [Leptospirillum sp. Group II 'C75']|jgi:septal ring factor EnvC (AmiA/AmiB activator)|uniref:peptidoglycan DD-metalloendopeptidase family protein n=1 Tax=Leptospirillum sp. Group II 'CF-1' TaxID=1660083 RepID=UPI0000F0C8F7|nr:M23 family metallopeptidase [Leptospirillum sp. Group II 'CF-1']EAY57327.1 MAG: putative peptidase, M23B family [Leptospirillum rubarum]EIJ77416.1 MAG: Putative peptidase, M23B family [Leptospirillum sp. Group II 'C75']MCL5259260.1 peptidoglycan DD-metalloendopeptidase family protein [Nitrospirota bacterium]
MKVKKTVTVTFMSGPTEKAKQWTFPRWLFHAFFVLGLLLVTGGISLVFFYVHEAQQLVTYRRLIRETAEQKTHLDTYRKELEKLEAQLSEVNLLDGQIRQMTSGQEGAPPSSPTENIISPVPPPAFQTPNSSEHPQTSSSENSPSAGSSTQPSPSPETKGIRFFLPPEQGFGWAFPLPGWETSPFGKRKSPLGDGEEFHTGLDIAQSEGARVIAAAGGSVLEVGKAEDYGRYVLLYHGRGVTTLYAHLGEILVHAGDLVDRGTPIGFVGMSGLTNGPHLHFEVRYFGVPVDPATIMGEPDPRKVQEMTVDSRNE